VSALALCAPVPSLSVLLQVDPATLTGEAQQQAAQAVHDAEQELVTAKEQLKNLQGGAINAAAESSRAAIAAQNAEADLADSKRAADEADARQGALNKILSGAAESTDSPEVQLAVTQEKLEEFKAAAVKAEQKHSEKQSEVLKVQNALRDIKTALAHTDETRDEAMKVHEGQLGKSGQMEHDVNTEAEKIQQLSNDQKTAQEKLAKTQKDELVANGQVEQANTKETLDKQKDWKRRRMRSI
jgi:chromosome segregation ATPase